ncbi:MAG: hypothetical protein OEY87_08620 [Gammaproteobacteria bacterium]|nr:hypothetical protein [Gammaproteobacteria bacterium]MDH5736169.1 hypothetical protein [Gammaproteobacteria bacterium]
MSECPDINILYCFKINEQFHETFDLHIDGATLEIIHHPVGDVPDWTRLDNHQCPHCPLETGRHQNCPVAISLVSVIDRFENVVSHDEIDLEVTTSSRKVSQHTTAQKAISSLLGLLFATSGCPYTNYLKPMARFHLPLSSEDDTIFRAAGMYLLAQYLLKQNGHNCSLELDGLKQIYDNLHLLNTSIAQRIRSASNTDSSVNAVILLDMFTNLMPFVIDEKLDEIRYMFDSYFRQ